MEVRPAATTPTAGDDAVVRILIAIELSKKSWIVGANTPLKAKTSQFQLAAGDWKALLDLIERLRRQVARELGRPVLEIEAISCYEAGYDGFQSPLPLRRIRTWNPEQSLSSRSCFRLLCLQKKFTATA
jgi:hypothetical protein